ncbi:ROK family protein [Sphingomonas sp.]|uniref:ROK family protein n=1 Tax=Sphingomonas sp. TaxID=28214 RepID=UPI003AFFD9F5
MADDAFFAGVELGGTKTVAVLGRDRDIVDRLTVPTTTPAETLAAVADRLAEWRRDRALAGLGVASFGPVALDPASAEHGRMLATPKPGWAGADVLRPLAEAAGAPARLHTDVTAAALAEGRWGAARGLADHAYVTIGTGIGVGLVANGAPVSGRMHPEAGHLRVRRLAGDGFAGSCPFHGDCLEGLASGPAIAARAGRPADALPPDDPAWSLVADALAEGFAALLTTLAPAAIVVGGGVGLGQPQLLPLVRAGIVAKLGGYLPFVTAETIATMIVPAALGGDAGPLGALLLAALAAGPATA